MIRFWLRETAWAWILQSPTYDYEVMSPLFIVVWNPDRTVEFYREGPYKEPERSEKFEELQGEIGANGLQEALFKRRVLQLNAPNPMPAPGRIKEAGGVLLVLWRAGPGRFFTRGTT